ncbi:MAG: recombinase family protein, partial [Janthinobacterium lividum]
MVNGDVVLEAEGVEQRLSHHPPAHHRRLHRTRRLSESRPPASQQRRSQALFQRHQVFSAHRQPERFSALQIPSTACDKPCRIAAMCGNPGFEVFRMLVGYMRVSSTDDRQSVSLQKDALVASGVDERHLHQDKASGARDDRPGLKG